MVDMVRKLEWQKGMTAAQRMDHVCDSIFKDKHLTLVRELSLVKGKYFRNPIGHRGRKGYLFVIDDEFEGSEYAMDGRYVAGGHIFWQRMCTIYPNSFDMPEFDEKTRKRVDTTIKSNKKMRIAVNKTRGYKLTPEKTSDKVHPMFRDMLSE